MTLKVVWAILIVVFQFGCSQEDPEDPHDSIRETGYLSCSAGVAECGLRCELPTGDFECVEPPAACEAFTCACLGAFICGDRPCQDLSDGIVCGHDADARDMGPDADLPDANLGVPDGGSIPLDTGVSRDALVGEPWVFGQTEPAESLELGLRGSFSRPDTGALLFVLTHRGQPVEGAAVRFVIVPGVPTVVTLQSESTTTDADGVAAVLISSLGRLGQVRIQATATVDDETFVTTSRLVSVRGGHPSMASMQLACDRVVVPGFFLRQRERNGDYLLGAVPAATCAAQLGDRFHGRVDAETYVIFMTEAGTVNQRVATDDEGTARSGVRVSQPAPVDVEPWPYELAIVEAGLTGCQGDDANACGGNTFNPRDGLVTLIAITRGEEAFVDLNGDGLYTDGEVFTDLPEPFVDANDNQTFDEGEQFRDSNGDGLWSEGNGEWDGNADIWVETRLLWVGPAAQATANPRQVCGDDCTTSSLCADEPLALGVGGRSGVELDFMFLDTNGNCVDTENALVSIEVPQDMSVVGPQQIQLSQLPCFHNQIPTQPTGVRLEPEGDGTFTVAAPPSFTVINRYITPEPVEGEPLPAADIDIIDVELSYQSITRTGQSEATSISRPIEFCR